MPRKAFAQALRFLKYYRVSSVSAVLASISLGFLYLFLIMLLGLFADLVVGKGAIPELGNPAGRVQVREWLHQEVLGDFSETEELLSHHNQTGLGLISLAWRCHQGPAPQRWFEPVVTAPIRWFSWTHTNTSYLTGLLILALVVALLRAGLTFVMHFFAARASIEASMRLRRSVYHHSYRLGTLAFRALGPSEAVSIFTRHLEAVHEGLYSWLTVVFREATKFVLLLLFALMIDPWLALAFLLFAVLAWLVGGQLAAYFHRQTRQNIRHSAEQLTLLQESIMIMRLVKCYLMEPFNQARVERQMAKYAQALLGRRWSDAIYQPALILFGVAAVAVLLYAAGWTVLKDALSVAGAITLSTTLISLYGPVVVWLEQRQTLGRAQQSAKVLFDFLDRRADVGQIVGAEFLAPMSKELEFDNVTLLEPGTQHSLLKGVSLRIAAGQRVALVGPDELEKHALVYLIPRFLDPQEGEIRIDSHDLRLVTLDSLRAQVAVVLQHNLVFNDTVATNIGCGDPGYTLPQVIEAAKVAHAHHFIQHLPNGYETRIGELGHRLTIGEQFRIALARAILRDPALVVIEEPTVPLDEDTKNLLDDAFARFLPGRTTLFLPHRAVTIRSCEYVFLLHKGRIESAGEHRELLEQSELYRHLQYLEFNVFAEQM